MNQLERKKKILSAGIVSMFFMWLIAVGALDSVVLLSTIISAKWLPIFTLVLQVFIIILFMVNRKAANHYCYRVPYAVSITLFLSAVIMVIILYRAEWEPSWFKPQPRNPNIPYIPALIVYPTAFVASLWYLLIGRKSRICKNCIIKHGSPNERGLVASLYTQESTIQLKVLVYMSLLLSIVTWIYYFMFYINVNMNHPDRFFFKVFPSLITVATLIFFYVRYNNMWRYYIKNPEMTKNHRHQTALRYLLFSGDRLFLQKADNLIIDTPVVKYIPFTNEVNEIEAKKWFKDVTGLEKFQIRKAYFSEDTTTLANAFHYLCFIDDENELENCEVEGQLYSYDEIVAMVKSKTLAPALRSELERIYTVAMASKTYTPEGKRIYPVKNYRPSFRFRDIKNWDVDYNDRNWLLVTVENEDKPFYRLKRFWRKNVQRLT